jgi:hypothetical protein
MLADAVPCVVRCTSVAFWIPPWERSVWQFTGLGRKHIIQICLWRFQQCCCWVVKNNVPSFAFMPSTMQK